MKQPETRFKEKVQRDLKKLPFCFPIKIQQRAIRGTPDLLVCLSGKFVALELKTDSGKVDALQEFTLISIAKAGGIALVVTPSNWEKIFQALHNFLRTGEMNV